MSFAEWVIKWQIVIAPCAVLCGLIIGLGCGVIWGRSKSNVR